MTKEKEYKTPKLTNILIELLVWIFLIGIFLGIWIPEYRWRLIFTSLFCIFIVSIIVFTEKIKKEEKKWKIQ